MAKVKITGHASGTGILTVTAPDTDVNRTITLPDATGTLLNSDGSAASLTAIPAANITGTLPAIDGSNLTGVATDLTSIRNDIATLALHSAIADNKAAYNLPNSFIDQFEDDTGIGTETDGDRQSGEYWDTVTVGVAAFTNDSNTVFLLHMDDVGLTDSSSNSMTTTLTGNTARSATESKFGSYSMVLDGAGDFLSTPDLDTVDSSVTTPTTGNFTAEGWFKQTSRSDGDRYFSFGNNGVPPAGSAPALTCGYNGAGGSTTFNSYGTTQGDNNITFPTESTGWHHVAAVRTGSTLYYFYDGVLKGSHSFTGDMQYSSGTAIIGGRSGSGSEYFIGYVDEFRYSNNARYTTSGSVGDTVFVPNEGTTASATGTLISTAQTANAAQTKVSGVILYKNNEGTATLGTDLKVYFTCNGGTNWTESTPTAAGTFSSGILMAKCPEVTCTSGTDVRYKVVWANQSAGSKETQLHGIGMNY